MSNNKLFQNNKCGKCDGCGWVWGYELDNCDKDTYDDSMTHYTCDWCNGTGWQNDNTKGGLLK